jgi:SAM-dependent methyltransferase
LPRRTSQPPTRNPAGRAPGGACHGDGAAGRRAAGLVATNQSGDGGSSPSGTIGRMTTIRYPFISAELLRRASPGARVLEVGCGAQPYRPDVRGQYVGMDLLSSDHLEGIRPHIAATVEQIPCVDATFDLIFGVAVFYLVEDIGSALTECRRVLKPGGQLLMFDYQRSVCNQLASGGAARSQWDAAVLRRLLLTSGFSSVKDISAIADSDGQPSLARLAARRVQRLLGRRGAWLVMAATREQPSPLPAESVLSPMPSGEKVE